MADVSATSHLQEVDPGQSPHKQTHTGLQHERSWDDGLGRNHQPDLVVLQQMEDLKRRRNVSSSVLPWTRLIWDEADEDVLTSRSFMIPGVSYSQWASFTSLKLSSSGALLTAGGGATKHADFTQIKTLL